MVWYFIGVYIINRTLHGRLEIQNFSSSVEKYFTSQRSEQVKYFKHSKRNSGSPRGRLIFSIFYSFIGDAALEERNGYLDFSIHSTCQTDHTCSS